LAGAGGKDKWRLYTSAVVIKFGDEAPEAFRFALLSELGPLAEIRCDACDGWGHTAGKKGKRCSTAARLYAIKGSKVMGKMISACMSSVKSERDDYDPAKAARRVYMKPVADDLGKAG
jgi:hypothetical protein